MSGVGKERVTQWLLSPNDSDGVHGMRYVPVGSMYVCIKR